MLLLMTACEGYVGIGRTESWAGLQILPLQLAYLQGEGPAWLVSLFAAGVFGLGFGLGSPLLCCRTLARRFLNHTCCMMKINKKNPPFNWKWRLGKKWNSIVV